MVEPLGSEKRGCIQAADAVMAHENEALIKLPRAQESLDQPLVQRLGRGKRDDLPLPGFAHVNQTKGLPFVDPSSDLFDGHFRRSGREG